MTTDERALVDLRGLQQTAPRLFNLLRQYEELTAANEQTILAQQAEIARLTAELEQARAWAKVWKLKAWHHRLEFQSIELKLHAEWDTTYQLRTELEQARAACLALVDFQQQYEKNTWDKVPGNNLYGHWLMQIVEQARAAVYQQLQPGDTAVNIPLATGRERGYEVDDPAANFEQWAAAHGYDLDTHDGRERAVAAYGTAGAEGGTGEVGKEEE